MPLKKCSVGNKSGWKYGDSGHCYTGPEGKKLAIKQGLAIDGPDKFKQEEEKSKGGATEQEIEAAIAELIQNGVEDAVAFDNPFIGSVHAYVSQKTRDKMDTEDFGWPEEKKFP